MPEMIPLRSSNLKCAGYAAGIAGIGNVTITFSSGKSYLYENVPVEVFNQLCEAESPGSFFAKEIKPKYKCTKLEG